MTAPRLKTALAIALLWSPGVVSLVLTIWLLSYFGRNDKTPFDLQDLSGTMKHLWWATTAGAALFAVGCAWMIRLTSRGQISRKTCRLLILLASINVALAAPVAGVILGATAAGYLFMTRA